LEHPELKGGLIDLGPEANPAERGTVVRELWDAAGEDGIAWRHGQRYVVRLAAYQPGDVPVPRLSAAGAYLITGGLGTLGLQVARFLAASGAGCLVLMGRRGASGHAQATLNDLRQQGTEVLVAQADCTDETAVRGVLETIAASGYTLKGVVHAAGVFDSRAVRDLDPACLRTVLAPKLQGAWALHRLTRDMALDFFVCFSSVAAVMGSTHLAHYAAANSFLDGLVAYRRGLGLPALSVNWGPWQGGGMAGGEATRRTASAGFKALAPQRALAVLGRILGDGESHVTVVDADWPRLKSLYEARGKQPLLELLETAGREERSAETSPVLQELQQTAARDRLDFLVGYLQGLVVDVLGFEAGFLPDSRQGFFDLGMDSLTAVEFKGRVEGQLGQPLSRSVVFDYPNIEALAGHLLQLLFPVQEAEQQQSLPVVAAAPADAQLSQDRLAVQRLSDLQIAALIDAELESLTDKG
jgi:hypothetical protein